MIRVKTEVGGIYLRFIANGEPGGSRGIFILDLCSIWRYRSVFTGRPQELQEHTYGVLSDDGTILEMADQTWLHSLVHERKREAIQRSLPHYLLGEIPVTPEEEEAARVFFNSLDPGGN